MKIIHTSDWHIGQNFYHFDRDDEHRHFFDQLAKIVETQCPDALVVSGDIFHNAAPSTAAQRLFVEGVMQIHDASPETVIVITAGNHDSASRIDAERELWRRLGIYVVGGCQRRDDGTFNPADFIFDIKGRGYVIAAPYFHISNYPMAYADIERDDRQKQFFQTLIDAVADDDKPIVMMAHLAVDGCNTRGHEDEPIGGMLKDNIAQLGDGYDYLALGHIHMPQVISDRAYYSGSPIPVSFSEDYVHNVNMVEIRSHKDLPIVELLPLDLIKHVKTIPAEGAPLDEALNEFEKFDKEDESYVRLLIDQEEMIAADAEDRARQIAKDKACKFCEVRKKPRARKITDKSSPQIKDITDFTNISPIEIAKRSFASNNDVEMSDTLIELMNHAINLATEESR